METKFDGYSINGKTNVINIKYIYLLDETNKKIDSSKIKNQTFYLQGKTKKPALFHLQLKNEKYPITIENTNYDVLINENKAMIIGGNLQGKLTNYQFLKEQSNKEKSKYHEQLVSKDINLRLYLKSIDSLREIEKNNFTDFILNNQNNILSAIALKQRNLSSKEAIQLKKLLDTSKNTKLLSSINTLSQNLKIEEAAKKIQRRKRAPLFSGINLSGSKSSLETILKGKKLFVIDFWASWCPPCRQSSPKLIKLYNIYHRKGFDILTVSEDRSVAHWKEGVYVDGIDNWHHIYDDYNRISSMYNVTSLPHLVLIDENGKIIKNKISLNNLEKYLDKKFNK